MKKLLTSIFLTLFFLVSNAQEPLSYSKVIQADSLNKSSIYNFLRVWFSESYKSSNNVIQMDDKDAGIIVGKGTLKYSYGEYSYESFNGYIDYTIKVQIKDGRYKVEMYNFTHDVTHNVKAYALGLITNAEKYTETGRGKKYYNNTFDDIKSKIKAYSESIFLNMEKSTTYSNKDSNLKNDW